MSGIINSTGARSGVIGTTVGSPPTNILQIKAVNGDSTDVEFYINRSRRNDNSAWIGASTSNLTVQEIKG